MLGGCGGCLIIAIVLVVIAANQVGSVIRDVANTPISAQSVRRDLGADVPIYPGAQLEEVATRVMVISFRTVEKTAGKKPGDIFKGVGAYTTSDSEEKIVAFYDKKLKAAGWRKTQERARTQGDQYVYQKGNDVVMLQVQEQGGQNMIVLMRGGPEMTRSMPKELPSGK